VIGFGGSIILYTVLRYVEIRCLGKRVSITEGSS
jgi:hypothetical protein